MGVLTTGFNAPAVDLIAMLRPTKSAGLYVQMAGRGTRLAPGKENCLVLDFAGNVARHGPIDAVTPKRPSEAEGAAPTKVCPDCDSILAAAVRQCPDCGHQFPPPEVKVAATATHARHPVHHAAAVGRGVDVAYSRHEKPGKPPSLRVDYHCGLVRHSEWICFEHTGYARQKAVAWWRARSKAPVPSTITDGAGGERRCCRRPPRSKCGRAAASPRSSNYRFEPCIDAGLCAVCHREPRGFGWFDAASRVSNPGRDQSHRKLCSTLCQDLCHRRRGMIDPTPNERAAMVHGGAMGGEYLDSLGKTDLAQLSTRSGRPSSR